MNEKIKIRKVSDYWGEHDCSSARNLPKTLQWLTKETNEPYDTSVYVDNYISVFGVAFTWKNCFITNKWSDF